MLLLPLCVPKCQMLQTVASCEDAQLGQLVNQRATARLVGQVAPFCVTTEIQIREREREEKRKLANRLTDSNYCRPNWHKMCALSACLSFSLSLSLSLSLGS